MTDGQWQIVIGVAALIVSIIFGLKAAAAIRRRRLSQHQRTGTGSVSIQSGRDTKIGRSR